MESEMPLTTGVPVICDRGHQYISNAIALGAGSTATMVGNRVGPCPACGAMGSVIDGVYSVREVAGRLITTLRALSRDDVIGIVADLQEARRNRDESQFDAAVDRLPEKVRSEIRAVVEKESAKGRRKVRWALIGMILTILLWMYPDLGKEAGQTVDHAVQSVVSSLSSVPDMTESEISKVVAAAIRAYEDSLSPPRPRLEPQSMRSKIGRNDLCPCGTGKKYKFCHIGRLDDPGS